jgi:hypothetical protein
MRLTALLAVATVAVAACSKSDNQSMDDDLKRDLAAATAKPQLMIVSEVEGGEAATPAKSPKRAPVAVKAPRQTPEVIAQPKPRAIPAPAPVAQPKAVEVAPQPVIDEKNVPPLPPAPSRGGVDAAGRKEGEIFSRMPWIRP